MPRKPHDPERRPVVPEVPLKDRRDMITPEELAGYVGVEVQTTDYWASRGGGPDFHKVGSCRRYWPEDVLEWLRVRRFSATGDPAPAA